MQCGVCGGVIYISNKSKYLKTESEIRKNCKDQSLNITSKVLSNKREI